MIAGLIKADPSKSDRQFAKELGVDHKTIGRARAEGEDVGNIPHVEKRTDTRGRSQPVRKPKTPNVEASDAEEAAALIAAEDKRVAEAQPTDPFKAARKAGEITGLLIGAGEAVQRVFIRRLPEMLAHVDDIGPNSAGEAERLRIRNEELEHEVSRLKRENATLCAELDQLRTTTAPPAENADGLDIPPFLRRVPAQLTMPQLVDLLEHRLQRAGVVDAQMDLQRIRKRVEQQRPTIDATATAQLDVTD